MRGRASPGMKSTDLEMFHHHFYGGSIQTGMQHPVRAKLQAVWMQPPTFISDTCCGHALSVLLLLLLLFGCSHWLS